jgi:hypothetical protein
MYEDEEYTARRQALQKEANQIVKQLEEFDPITGDPKEMDKLFKRMREIENGYEDLLIELNVEVLLVNVHDQLVKEGYITEE